jgi:hypothetical protein
MQVGSAVGGHMNLESQQSVTVLLLDAVMGFVRLERLRTLDLEDQH